MSPTAQARHQKQRDAGYTLVELLIYSSLLVLILMVVGGMLLNTITSEQKVLDSADANGVSQLISSSVHSGVRNATALNFDDFGADNGDQLLVVTAVSTDPDSTAEARVCQAWYYTENDGGAIYYKSGNAPQTFGASLADALVNDMAGWTLLGSGLSATENATAIPPEPYPIFTDSTTTNPSITLNFAINADSDSSPALISTMVTSRQGAAPSSEPRCF